MAYILGGPVVALLGIAAVFFVLRRKSEEKRSMYSARRQQIEHKVRAARQRTLTPHGHAPKAADQPAAAQPSAFDQARQVQPTVAYQYQAPAYEAPPVASPPPPPRAEPAPAAPMPWDTPAAPDPASTGWDFPPATTTPAPAAPTPEPFRPAPEPTPMPPSEPSWTPAPRPAEPLAPAQSVAAAASSTAAGSWEVVSATKDSASTAAPKGKKGKGASETGSAWSLASGDSPGMEGDEETELKRPSGTIVAVAQYAVLVVGLVMVLIGVLVMVANSHVT
jgi:hypothetical protein